MSQPQTEALEKVVQAAGMWEDYQKFIKILEFTAKIKYPNIDEENVDAFMKTAKYSYCAGINDTLMKIGGELEVLKKND